MNPTIELLCGIVLIHTTDEPVTTRSERPLLPPRIGTSVPVFTVRLYYRITDRALREALVPLTASKACGAGR